MNRLNRRERRIAEQLARTRDLEPAPTAAGQVLDAQLHLLDRQILDRADVPITTVDDIELSDPPPGSGSSPVIAALLTGPVLGTRIFGGRPPASRWERIPWRDVAEVGIVVRLGIEGAGLSANWTERWVRDHIIGRIPGGRHDPDAQR